MRGREWILQIRKQWRFLVYVLIGVSLRPAELPWNRQILFFGYFVLLFFLLDFLLKFPKEKTTADKNSFVPSSWGYLLLFAFLFILITRLMPFYQFGEAPLGYDTGFYLRNFYANESSLLSFSAYYLNLVPLTIFGLTPLHAISFIYVISQLLIAGGLYILFRTTKIKESMPVAAVAIFLFSISALQFYAYCWMLGQQMLAMAFLLITIALLFRKPLLAIFTGLAGLLFHVPTFGLFALAFFIFSIINILYFFIKRKPIDHYLIKLFVVGACFAIFALFFKGETFWQYFKEYIIEHKGLYLNFPFWEIVRFKGAFLSVSTMNITSIILMPFTVYGILRPRLWQRAFQEDERVRSFVIFLYVSFLILLPLVLFPVIYQQRFMIILDIFIIIFASPVIYLLVSRFINDKTIKIILFGFLLFSFYNVGNMIWNKKPHIPPEELQEIKTLSANAEADAYVVATNSFYTPWIYGFSGRKSYGPGWGPDPWSYNDWLKFWTGTDNKEKISMISSTFSSPVYFFIGEKQKQGYPFQAFIETSEHFIKISPHIWKWK